MGIHEVDRGLGADVAVPPSSIEAESNNYFRKISDHARYLLLGTALSRDQLVISIGTSWDRCTS